MAGIVIQNATGMGVMRMALKSYDSPTPPGGWNKANQHYKYGALSFPTGYQAIGMYLASKAVRETTFKKEILDNLKESAEYVKSRHYFPENKGFVHSPSPWRAQSVSVGGVGANALRNVLLIDAVLTGDKESEKIARETFMQMLEYRELYHSPQKKNDPDTPTAKNVGAIIYFIPFTMDLMEKLGWELPETVKYAPLRKHNSRGSHRKSLQQKLEKKDQQ